MNNIFLKLVGMTGGYTLPYLVHIYNVTNTVNLYYINDNVDLNYNGHTYKASSFEYTPSTFVHGLSGGATFNISGVDEYGFPNELIEFLETHREIKLEVIGVLLEDGSVSEIKTYKNHYGKVKVQNMTLQFTFEEDDRLKMTFPALIFNKNNNRGNA